jgi:hypothetical protein
MRDVPLAVSVYRLSSDKAHDTGSWNEVLGKIDFGREDGARRSKDDKWVYPAFET